ncbi:ATP-dependent zinc protease family protein [Kordiimonas pumila]|uniref:ATP-dependent zinc protease n=1 Tax=Kordiimonas pumila TaxID=2161677 RepID=A0ABV7D6U4_9PROT|nr:RimK/LysX family protein [Kordiimonas pumila]
MVRQIKKDVKSKVTVIGWREHIAFPDLNIPVIRAKIDTGARTSALHATHIKPVTINGAPWVEFCVPIGKLKRQCCFPLCDVRAIKNTSGVPEERYVIETLLVMGKRRWHIEVSLADRENMGFDLILGRTSIRGRHIMVDPGKSFLVGPPVPASEAVLTKTIEV